jgi:uncharacterized repeat protein (TIGR01451 family)
MRRVRSALVFIFGFTAISLVPIDAAVANQLGNQVLVPDTDFVAAGVGGMRGTGTGSITVSGVSGTVTQALLYWNGPTNSEVATANAAVKLNGTDVLGTNIGFSADNCWGFANSQSYRADVTSLVNGNGNYSLSEFRKVVFDGETQTTVADVNGASLIVFFDDGDDANNRDVTIVDGNDSNFSSTFDAEGWDATIPDIDYRSGEVNLQLHVSDGQSFIDGAVFINDAELLAEGGNFQGDSVPGTFGGNPEGATGNLWDITDHTITSFMTSPSTTLNLTSPLASDCLSLVTAVVDVPSAQADLNIDKVGQPETVTAGEDIRYTVTVDNIAGPDDASNVVMTDTLPNGTTFLGFSADDSWECLFVDGEESDTVTCTRASIPAGETAPAIDIDVQAPSTAGEIVNTATVSADETDPNASNDTATATTLVQASTTPDTATTFCADGCTLDTDPGTGATRTDPTVTFLIVPDDADPQTVSILEFATTPTHCGGSPCNGQLVQISEITGVETPAEPIKAKIVFDKTVKGGTQIYIQKPPFTSPAKLVANCSSPNVASPHPCVSSKIVLPNGDREITVLLLSDDPILGKK